jgi:MFS family permease
VQSMITEGSTDPKKRGLLFGVRTEFSFIVGNFLIMVLSWLVLDFASELPATYYPLYVQALGGTAATIGLIGAAEQLARGFVQIPGGYLADKYGRKWLISTMTFVAAIARVFYVLAPSWEWILIGAVLVGVTNIYGPALNAIVADSVPKEKRGMAFSIINLIASVSTTPAPLLAGFLYARMSLIPSIRIGYTVTIIGFLIAALLRLRLKETVQNPTKINLNEMAASYPASFKESLSVWKLVPASAFVLFVVNIFTSFTIGLFQPVLTLYIINDLGIDAISFSYLMTILFVTMIILAIPAGKLIDKIGKKKPLLIAYLSWLIAAPLLIWGNFPRLVVSMSLIGLLQVLFNSAENALFADLVPREHRGKANGSMGFFSLIGMSVGQLAGGWIYDNVSHPLPFILQLGLMLPPFFLTYLYVNEPKKSEE